MTKTINTASLDAAMRAALLVGGSGYVYMTPRGVCYDMMPCAASPSDSLLWSREAAGIEPLTDWGAVCEAAAQIIINCNLINEANAILNA